VGVCVAGENSSQAAELLVDSSTEEQGQQRIFGDVRRLQSSPRTKSITSGQQDVSYIRPSRPTRNEEKGGSDLRSHDVLWDSPLLPPSSSESFATILTPPHNPKNPLLPLFLCTAIHKKLCGLRRIIPCDTNPQILRFLRFLRVVLLVAAKSQFLPRSPGVESN